MTDTLEARIEARLKRNFPIYDYVGLEIESASDGIYRCAVPLRESNVNHIATVHAAIQWAAAEVLGGMVVMSVFGSEPVFAVVTKVSIDFTRPARSAIRAETLFAEAEAAHLRETFEHEGEAEFSLRAVVRGEDGGEVAASKAQYLVRKPRQR